MDGPTAATRSAGRASNARASALTAAAGTPAANPRQPAWAAATAPLRESASRSGTQSAVWIAIATSGSFESDDVRLGTRARREAIAGAVDHDRRAMNLTKPHQVVEVDAQRRRHRRPFVVAPGSGTERPLARRKEVIGQGPQRPADQRGSSGRLHPYEAIARLWSHHLP